MKIPKGLQALVDDGKVDAVLRQLKSGKEAAVYVVACGADIRCAKVYKDAEHRGFHKLAAYQEGRKARGSRDARARPSAAATAARCRRRSGQTPK